MARIVALSVGRPRTLKAADGKSFVSAIAKTPIEPGVRVPIVGENLDGDYQANRKVHGGPDKALCCYPVEHYPVWDEAFLLELPHGAFGENLTLEGLTEGAVCLGDTFAVGDVRLQVSQPRQPCNNLVKRWGVRALPEKMIDASATGFYFRVLRPGDLGVGDILSLDARPHPDWSIRRANAAMYGQGDAGRVREERVALRGIAELSAEWKRMVQRRLNFTPSD